MPKNKAAAAFFVVVFMLYSCLSVDSCMSDKYGLGDLEDGPLPEAVFLLFTAENNMNTPVTIRIRHYYDFTRSSAYPDKDWVGYSEWEEFRLGALETKNIGSDIWNGAAGFSLLNTEIEIPEPHNVGLRSSYEIEISTVKGAYSFAGYYDEEAHSNDEGLCFFNAIRSRLDVYCSITTKTQRARIWEKPFVLPVKLTVLANGRYAFTHDKIVKQDGVDVVQY
jgi:hypothetical protein